MPRFAANLSFMFNEVPFLDRFAAARGAGFEAVEFLFPYDHPPAELRSRLDDNGLKQVLFNLPPGDWAAGERGIAALPGRTEDFHNSVKLGLEYAAALGCGLVHCMAGLSPPGVQAPTLAAIFATNLNWAAEQATAAGVKLVIEPINHRDMPRYFMHTTRQASAVIDAVGRDRVGLQFDIYHCQITEGDITKHVEALLPIIAHMQLADVPARNEPGTGEIGWPYVFRRIDDLGYTGWIGCEDRPVGDTVEGLGWRKMAAA